jgi:hypothetical protein
VHDPHGDRLRLRRDAALDVEHVTESPLAHL